MKVLFLVHAFPIRVTEALGSDIVRLAVALRDQGIECRIVAPTISAAGSVTEVAGVTVERFRVAPDSAAARALRVPARPDAPDLRGNSLATFRLLGAEFVGSVLARREFEPDVLHAHRCFPDGLVGTWVSSLASLPLVTTIHASDVRLARTVAASRPMLRHVLKRSAAVTTPSPRLGRALQEVISSPEPLVIPMPAAPDDGAGPLERRGDRLLAAVTRGGAARITTIMRALAELPASVSLEVVGHPSLAEAVDAAARTAGVEHRVHWSGQPSPEAFRESVRAARSLIVGAEEEAERIAVSALLAETPLVVLGEDGGSAFVHHERTGLLVRDEDVDALVRALSQLRRHPGRAAALASAGRMHALATFAPESVARRFVRIYQATLGVPTA